jgi:Leucine-rich repeat (LRR) protein
MSSATLACVLFVGVSFRLPTSRLFADDLLNQRPRGAVLWYLDPNRMLVHSQLLQFVGPDSAQLACPVADKTRFTCLSLYDVPMGISLVRQVASVYPITELTLRGVGMDATDLKNIVHLCPNLIACTLYHRSTVLPDEASDLTTEEVAAVATHDVGADSFAILAELPQLKALVLRGYPVTRSRLKFASTLKQLKVLSLCDMKITDADLEALSALSEIEVLDLSGTLVTGSGLHFLKPCSSLTTVILSRAPIDNAINKGVVALPHLKYLILQGVKLTTATISSLETACPFAEIVTGDCPSYVLKCSESHGVQALRLYRAAYEGVNDVGIASMHVEGSKLVSLKIRPHRSVPVTYLSIMRGLKALGLSDAIISDTVVNQISAQQQLETLDLSQSSIGDETLQQLQALDGLTWIGLRHTKVGDAGIKSLLKCKRLANVDLTGSRVTDQGCQVLRRCPQLKAVQLANCAITDDGAKELAKIGGLEYVGLDNTAVTDRGVCELAKLPQLKWIRLINCKITDVAAKELLKSSRLENCQVDGSGISQSMLTEIYRHVNSVRGQKRGRSGTSAMRVSEAGANDK